MGLFSGIVDAVKGGIKGFASGGWMGAAAGAIGGLGNAADTAVTTALDAKGQQQTNQMNVDLANRQNQFSADQAQISRDWNMQALQQSQEFNSAEAVKQREFSALESWKQRDWSENMSNTQYQRATKDMEAAGLNPMLGYSQGGAGVPSGAAASSGAASSGPAMGATASAGSTPRLESALGAAVNTGFKASELQNLIANSEAQRSLLAAQADAQTARAQLDRQSAAKTYLDTELMSDTFGNQVNRIVAESGTAQQREKAAEFETEMQPVTRALKNGEIGLQQAQIAALRAGAALNLTSDTLKRFEIPGARAQANFDASDVGQNMPGLKGVGDLIGTVAGSAFGIKRFGSLFRGVGK